MNGGKAFFDTNVLLYMYSGADLNKQNQARELFRQCMEQGRILVSTQVVQEFYAAGSRKLGMPRPQLREAISALLDLPLVVVGAAEITSAIDSEGRYSLSFWDALILAAAESGGADIVYSEDLSHGQQYGGVTVRNPFSAGGLS